MIFISDEFMHNNLSLLDALSHQATCSSMKCHRFGNTYSKQCACDTINKTTK